MKRETTTESVHHVLAGQHQVLQPRAGVKLHLLHSSSAYQAFLIEVEANTDCAASPHDGEELRYVISGKVLFKVGTRDHVVVAGGSLRHPSSTPHGFRTEEEPARFVTFALSRDYDLRKLFRGMLEGENHRAH